MRAGERGDYGAIFSDADVDRLSRSLALYLKTRHLRLRIHPSVCLFGGLCGRECRNFALSPANLTLARPVSSRRRG